MEKTKVVKIASKISVDHFESVIQDIEKMINELFDVYFEYLGSTGKKQSGYYGDIDIGIEWKELEVCFENSDRGYIFQEIENKLQKISPEIHVMKSLNIISFAYKIDGNKYVQIDFILVESLRWAKFGYFSPSQKESKYKGLHRNIFLFSIARNSESYQINEYQIKKKIFDMKSGLYEAIQKVKSEKTNKLLKHKVTVQRTLITNVPDEATKILFGTKFSSNDITSFEKIFQIVLNDDDFILKEKKNIILSETYKDFKERNFECPEELENYIEEKKP